jgi:hypothetical protein
MTKKKTASKRSKNNTHKPKRRKRREPGIWPEIEYLGGNAAATMIRLERPPVEGAPDHLLPLYCDSI